MKERYLTKSAVYIIIRQNDRFLFQRRKNTGYLDGWLDLGASGHVEEGETAREAVVREVKEEIGLIISVDQLIFTSIHHRHTNDQVYYDFYFLIDIDEKAVQEININEPEKISELVWLSNAEFSTDIIEYHREVLEQLDQGVYYREIGW